MSIKVACLECNRVYEIPDSAAGRKGKCECGAVLNVPAKPVPIASKPRPPRTLDEAAAMAEKQREPVYDPAGIAELAEQSRQARNAEAAELPEPDIYADGATPPPLQTSDGGEAPPLGPPPLPAFESNPPAGRPAPSVVRNYANLHRLCRMLRLQATIALWLSILFATLMVISVVFTTGTQISAAISTGYWTRLFSLVGIPAALVAGVLAGGFTAYTLLNAVAEFLYVQMDIEENTRR
jgi:hypothetical protein